MEKRYQVFVSSTYTDLLEERSEVMQALLELECMPAGMELFPAASDSQWDWITKVIDESDYYIVLVGGRYGSISQKTGLSFTEMEYRYAVDAGKPVLGFLREDPENIPSKHTESSPDLKKKLDRFRDHTKTRLCKFYNSPSDLGAKVSRSITQLKKQYPAVGWVRADVFESIASPEEELRLSRENEELRAKIAQFEKGKPLTVTNLASGNEKFAVDFNFTIQARNPETGRLKKSGVGIFKLDVSWDEIFKAIGPRLLRERTYWGETSYDLVDLLWDRGKDRIKKKYPKGESFNNFQLLPECRETIYMQFRALQLVEIDKRGDWKLSPRGDRYLSDMFAVKSDSSQPDATPNSAPAARRRVS